MLDPLSESHLCGVCQGTGALAGKKCMGCGGAGKTPKDVDDRIAIHAALCPQADRLKIGLSEDRTNMHARCGCGWAT